MSVKKSWPVLLFGFAILARIYFNGLYYHLLNSDEHEWVRRGVIFSELYFFDKNFSDPIWQQYESRDMPKGGQYLYGIWLRILYGEKMSEKLERIDFNDGWKRSDGYGELWNIKYWWANGSNANIIDHQQSFKIIITARYLSVFLTLLGLILFFYFCEKLIGLSGGALAVLVLVSNRFFHEVTRQALLDGPLFFGAMLAFVGMVLLAKKTVNWKQEVLLLLTAGVLFSVGALIKLNGLMFLPVGFMTMLGLKTFGYSWKRGVKFRQLIVRYFVVAVFVFGLYWISDPLLWPNPIRGLSEMLETRASVASSQALHSWLKPLFSISTRPIYIIETFLNGSYFGNQLGKPIAIELVFIILGLWSLLGEVKKLKISAIIFLFGNIWLFLAITNYLLIGTPRHVILLFPFLALIEVKGIFKFGKVLWSILQWSKFRFLTNS